MGLTLSEIARLLRGDVIGNRVLVPGPPPHSSKDRSLSIQLSSFVADGFFVHSFAGDDFRICRDYVAAALGMSADRRRQDRLIDSAEEARRAKARHQAEARERAAIARRQRSARRIWQEAGDARDTLVEVYLGSRALGLSEGIARDVLRFHAHCPFGEGTTAPAMVAALRSVRTGDIVGIHRTALTPDGIKVDRRMLGVAMNAAVMLDPLSDVTKTLVVAEGIETALAGRQHFGLAPIWALGSSGSIASLPVLPDIKTLVVVAENDGGASAAAIETVGRRWQSAGRGVEIVTPPSGAKDLNDAIKEGVCA